MKLSYFNKLLIILLISCLGNFALLADAQPVEQFISVKQILSHSSIYSKESGQSPDHSAVSLTLTGIASAPKRNTSVVLVLDISNSMSGLRLSASKNAANTFIKNMDKSRDKIGLVTFNSKMRINLDPKSSFDDVIKAINSIDIDNKSLTGNTCLSIGLKEAIRMLGQEKDSALKAIIFLSDGNNSTCTIPDNPCEDATFARDQGIIIYGIGIGDSGKGTNYLKCMADTTGGSYYSAETNHLEMIYENLSKSIPNIIAKNVVLKYRVPEDVEVITTDSRVLVEDGHNLAYNIGTISFNEQKQFSFDVSSTKAGTYPLGITPGSVVELTRYDNIRNSVPIPEIIIGIKPGMIPSNPIHENNATNISDAQFSLVGQGGKEISRDQQTNVSVQKLIMPNEQGTGPKIVFKITAPKIKKLDLVIAADSSGSTMLYPDQTPTDQDIIKELIPQILNDLKSRGLDTKVSILSWDDNVDFAYGPIYNTNASEAKLTDLKAITSKDIKLILENYKSMENESTNLNIGLKNSILILNNNKPSDPTRTLRCILFITDRSEFTDLISDLDNETRSNYRIYPLGLNPGPMMVATLKKMADETDGRYVFTPSTATDSKTVLNSYLELMDNGLNKTPIAENVTIVDSLYPYLEPDQGSLVGARFLTDPMKNPDGTTTLNLEVDGGLIPGETKEVSFNAPISMRLPVEVTDKRSNFEYRINPNTSISELSYTWLMTKKKQSLPLPEDYITITSANIKTNESEVPSKSKESGLEFGFITILAAVIILARRWLNE